MSESSNIRRQFDKSPIHKPNLMHTADMGKQDRVDLVRDFLAYHQLALPPRVIHRNLRLRHNATFSFSACNNYLSELVESGDIQRLEPAALENRELIETDPGDSYYFISPSRMKAADPSRFESE
jgi:hypothetical protein